MTDRHIAARSLRNAKAFTWAAAYANDAQLDRQSHSVEEIEQVEALAPFASAPIVTALAPLSIFAALSVLAIVMARRWSGMALAIAVGILVEFVAVALERGPLGAIGFAVFTRRFQQFLQLPAIKPDAAA
jgi:hypothetical protein